MLAARGHIGMVEHEISWVEVPQPHRLVAAKVSIPGLPKMILQSVYLQVMVGMDTLNKAVVASALMTGQLSGLHNLMLGDWNMSPATIWRSGILSSVARHQIGALDGPTFVSPARTSVLDFAVVQSQCWPLVAGVQLRKDLVTTPHRVVQMLLHPGSQAPKRWIVQRPFKSGTSDRASGCQ